MEKFRTWAQTPPKGWNSWDSYGAAVTEKEVRQNAEYMKEHLIDYGKVRNKLQKIYGKTAYIK